MAKLPQSITARVIPIPGYEGLYVRDLPATQFADMFSEEKVKDAEEQIVVEVFSKVICDASGDSFDEFQVEKAEDLQANVSVNIIYDIMQAVPALIVPKDLDLGNLEETGSDK